ncbi:DUF6113 family protein [Streptosporangium sp. NBC_01495]|uniref:DUF6113 family protein n=1 Tax=Streptosporangium sp. NBC_01495 TaxID=2903899 RepID=UPI002E3795AF|nr:DUF6113 family protein [Streptosporangium sp. NBC_01495]
MLVMEQVPAVREPSETVVAVAANAVLFLLGLLLGVLGGFQHSWYVRPVPVSAVGCLALLFAITYGAGRMTRGKMAALAFTAGWALVTVIWISGRPEGDLVIANDLSGYLYFYGGLTAVAVGVLLSPSAAVGGSWLLTPHGYRSGPESSPVASGSQASPVPFGSQPPPASPGPPAQVQSDQESGQNSQDRLRSGWSGPDQAPSGWAPPDSQAPPVPPGPAAH